MISKLKIVAATIVIMGVVVGYLDMRYAPHGLLLEDSPDRPFWLAPWLGWAVTSASAVLYIVLDYLESKSRAPARRSL
jgi:hypothetical protein